MKTNYTLSDCLWVLKAYLRGKVLQQKGYQPQEDFYFVIPESVTVKRMKLLIRLWGLRPATLDETMKLIFQEIRKPTDEQRHVPYINAATVNNFFAGNE